MPVLDFDLALKFVKKAKAIGARKGADVSVAILDDSGHPILVARGKPQSWHGPYMAMGKARLAAAFKKPTKDLMEQWEKRPYFPISLVEIIPGGVTLNAGAYPIVIDGVCIGAIGVGGGSPAVDDAVALETVKAMKAFQAPSPKKNGPKGKKK
jgi:glc operon protein GlcG